MLLIFVGAVNYDSNTRNGRNEKVEWLDFFSSLYVWKGWHCFNVCDYEKLLVKLKKFQKAGLVSRIN